MLIFNRRLFIKLFDVVDINRKPLGYTKIRGEELLEHEYNVGVEIWIFNDKKLLMTRRSLKKSHPREWEVPGECSLTKESSIYTIIRELKEEIGISMKKIDVKLIDTQIYEKQFVDIYLSNLPVDINDITIQESEADEVKFATQEEFLKMANNNGKFLTRIIVSYDDIVEVNNKRHLLKRIKQKEPLIMDIYI